MSMELDDADLIRTRLMTAPNLDLGELPVDLDITGIDPVIDRQQDILTAIKGKVGKAGGVAILIAVQDYSGFTPGSKFPRADLSYTITVWAKDVINAGEYPAAQVMKSIMRRLWHWNPRSGHSLGEVKFGNGGRVPNGSFTIYDIPITIPTSF